MPQQNEIEKSLESFSVKFHGGIINTLTKQLPTDLVAFRELIKNAYDASADNVVIHLDTKQRTLIIEDDGDGMDLGSMRNLFHLGQSSKRYGSTFLSTRSREKRYVQGSKGIGFLAAMHFGSHVTWYSARQDEYISCVSCERDELKVLEDLNKAEIRPKQLADKRRGTRIVIEMDDYHYGKAIKSFESLKWRSKLANTFRQSSFRIQFVLDGEVLQCEYLSGFKKRWENNHQFYVRFSSEKNVVEIFNDTQRLDVFAFSEHPCVNNLKISGEIIILKLSSSYGVKCISDLFKNKEDSLTPLLYVNDNLFEDYSLFNPDVTRKIKGTKSLAQMIGYIDVICDSPELDYNPDRTQFVENTLTDYITDSLEKLNENIQEYASAHKKEIGKTLKLGFKIPRDDVPRVGIVTRQRAEYMIPSPPIPLRELIVAAYDSSGEEIDRLRIHAYIDGEEVESGVLESQITSGCVVVDFHYRDSSSNLIAAQSQLIFKAEKQTKPQRQLFDYVINKPCGRDMKLCASLTYELNKLYSAHKESYNELYACALRTVFELAASAVRSTKILSKEEREKLKMEPLVAKVAELITEDQEIIKLLVKNSDLGYHTISSFEAKDFVQSYKASNRGAHSSTAQLTNTKISDIAKDASIFSYLVNAMLYAKKHPDDEQGTK